MEGLTENGQFNEKRPTWTLLAGLALVALLSGVAVVSCGGAVGKQETAGPVGDGTDVAQAGADLGHPSLGEEDAPVLMIEHSDYQ